MAVVDGGGLSNVAKVNSKSALKDILTGHDTRPNKTESVSHSERSTKVIFDLILCSRKKKIFFTLL